MSMISSSSPAALREAGLVEVGERAALLEVGERGRLLRAPRLVLLDVLVGRRVGAAERVALVAHDGEDLVVGEVAALLGHHAERPGRVRATLAVGVAVAVDAGEVVLGGAEVDEAQLVLDVRERLQHLAAGERPAAATLAAGAVAATSTPRRPRRRRRSDRRRPPGPGDRADVHEQPDRHQAQRGHRPERDLRPLLRRRDVRRIRLRRRGRCCRGRGLARRPVQPGRGRRARPLWSPPACSPPARPLPAPARPRHRDRARRAGSRDRFSRCSGISVTRRHDTRLAEHR